MDVKNFFQPFQLFSIKRGAQLFFEILRAPAAALRRLPYFFSASKAAVIVSGFAKR